MNLQGQQRDQCSFSAGVKTELDYLKKILEDYGNVFYVNVVRVSQHIYNVYTHIYVKAESTVQFKQQNSIYLNDILK